MEYKATYVDGHAESTIAHFGIPHQKWGVRRFQNPDGTLTEEGRRRYGVGKTSKQDDRLKNLKFKTSDVYALEGAKRGGLIGAGVGKLVGVYKERQERKQDKDRLTKEERKVFDDAAELEKKALYDFSVKDRTASKENVAKTRDQLQNLCDAHFDKLASVVAAVYGRHEVFNNQDGIFEGSVARQLALRFNEQFDVDQTFDQHMDEWVSDYSNGQMTKQEFKNHYEAELNDRAAWLLDTYNTEELTKIAKTFVDGEDNNEPRDSWRAYLKSRGKDDPYQESNAKQNSKTVNAVGLPKGVTLPSNLKNMSSAEKGAWLNSLTDSIIDGKSSGRYATGSKSGEDTYKPNKDNWKEVSKGVYEPTEKLPKQPKGKYISVIAKNGSRSMVRIEDKAAAAVTLGFMGLSQSEIANKLGISEEQLKKELASYKPPSYNGGIGVGRISKK